MEQRRAVTRQTAKRCRRASKKEKGQILDEHVRLNECTHNHVSRLLRN